jgi:hypothetical protein
MASIYKRLSSNNYANGAVPIGGATAANQVIEINLLTSIDSEIAASNITLLSIDNHVDGVETLLTSIDNKLTAPISVTGPLTDTQLRATPVPVTGSFSITGVATSANQTNGSQKTQIVDGSGNVISSTANALNVNVSSATTLTISGSVSVNNFPATQAISAVSLPLPTGAATSALQTTGNSSLSSIDSKLTTISTVSAKTLATQVVSTDTGLVTNAVIHALSSAGGGTYVDVKANPSGALTVDATVSSSILPTGAATSALQTSGNASLTSIDSKLTSPLTVTVNNFPSSQNVVVTSSALPTGASTSALQTTGNSSLSSIDSKTPALGQALMAASSPVVIASNQSAIPVSGTVAVTGPLAVTQSGAWNVGLNAGTNAIGSITNTSFIATQATGTNLHTVVDSGTVSISGSVAVTGPLTDTQLRATPVPISGTVTANIGTTNGLALDTSVNSLLKPASTLAAVTTLGSITNTVNVAAASLPLPTGAATETTLSALNTKVPTGLTVTSTRLLVDGSGVTQPISAASLPLPTGAATAANQTSEITLLNTIATNTGAQSVDTLATGNITALNGTLAINAQGAYTVSVNIAGTWVATLVAEGLMADGTTWVQLPMSVVTTTLPYASVFSTTTNGQYLITGGGYTSIRIRASAFTSGTVVVGLNASLAQQTIFSAQLGAWSVNGPTLTKGTQGATGFSTQDLKDAGRVIKVYSATFTAATTEALVTLTPISDGTAGGTATTFAITAGKRFRIQAINVTTRNAGAAGQGVVVNLRMTNTGAVTATSPLVATAAAGTQLTIANVTATGSATIPDGLELSGTMQFGISQVGSATANNTVTLIGYEY